MTSTAKSNITNILNHRDGLPLTAKSIAERAYIIEDNDTSSRTRKIIRGLINEGHCIGSSKEGYYLMTTGKEVQVYLNSLLKRQVAISERIQAVYKSATEKGLL